MNSLKNIILAFLVSTPFLVIPVLSHAQSEDEKPNYSRSENYRGKNGYQDIRPDLVITEDSQIALKGRSGKSVIGSCQDDDALWKGKIAIKNIGRATVQVLSPDLDEDDVRSDAPLDVFTQKQREKARERAREEKEREQRDKYPPHVRVYVPNNIELFQEKRLSYSLKQFGQELLEFEIGKGENKCRDYRSPPVFDPYLSGFPKRGGYRSQSKQLAHRWKVRQIQLALINKKLLSAHPNGIYGPQTRTALKAYFKSLKRKVPVGVTHKELSPTLIRLLFEVLKITSKVETSVIYQTDSECIKGLNYVPIYVEIDPKRKIRNEKRNNNKVQFTVEIDCTSVAR